MIGPKTRRKFWNMNTDNMYCQYCKTTVTHNVPIKAPTRATIDHVKPVSDGGTSEMKNLVVCCYICNQRKRSQTPERFLGNPLNFIPHNMSVPRPISTSSKAPNKRPWDNWSGVTIIRKRFAKKIKPEEK